MFYHLKKNLKAITVGLGSLFLNKLEENTIFHISLRFTSASPARTKSKRGVYAVHLTREKPISMREYFIS